VLAGALVRRRTTSSVGWISWSTPAASSASSASNRSAARAPNAVHVLADGRQPQRDRDGVVVEPDDRQLAGTSTHAVARGLERPERQLVAAGEHRRGRVAEVEQPVGGGRPVRDRRAGSDDEVRIGRHADVRSASR
jgi:hypothetical protein